MIKVPGRDMAKPHLPGKQCPFMAVLHVLNGDALRPAFAQAGLRGDVVVCRDMLSEGPVPGGLEREAHWRQRASELETRFDVAPGDYLEGAQGLRTALAEAAKHDEVALWFEQDLFCLVNLAFCLQALAAHPPAKVTFVMPPAPLGAKHGPAMPELFARRTDARPLLAPAQAFWRAYCGDDPRALAAVPRALPWQAEGVQAHFLRFPAPGSGVNVAEAAVLRVLREHGPLQFGELFLRAQEQPGVRVLGSGDLALAAVLRDLARGPDPLVTLENAPDDLRLDMADVMSWEAAAVPEADAVLRGDLDAVAWRGVDRWLGGVHLQGRGPVWRWDALAGRLTQA